MQLDDLGATSIRPTRNRLLAAMGVSTCVIALLLAISGLLADLALSISRSGIATSDSLILLVRMKVAASAADPPMDDDLDVSAEPDEPADTPGVQPELVTEDLPQPPDEPKPATDWHAMVDQVARTTVDDYYREKETMEALWRRSPSIMFEPGEELVLKDETPVIADLRFVPEIHVLGLGFTLGSCFFGVPIAGVPVEQRSAAITLIVCADGS